MSKPEPTGSGTPRETRQASLDFIRAMVSEDVKADKHGGRVATRFPPEPNGFLHIGHAKSICLNFGIADEYGGTCNLRFDDTNPITEEEKYAEAIQQDVRWLGYDWDNRKYYASDYFEQLYAFAMKLAEEGKAYVDSLSEEEIREHRGTVTRPGRESPYRNRSVQENVELLERMRAGDFKDGEHVLRAKIDMAAPNMLMRDPLLFRIRHAHHYRRGDEWCIYPMYDFAHCLSDAIEGITHSLCTLEFKDNRELYDWIVNAVGFDDPPEQTEFARLELDHTVLSKRKLIRLVREGHVSGWDDPRMPTIAGLRRRGVTPEAIRAFCDLIGVAKVNSRVDIGKLEYCVRDDLNQRVPRVMCVLRPLRVIITNYPEGQTEWLDAPYYPHDVPKEGSRKVPFSCELFIEREDFREDPPRGYFRLAPGREVRLRYGYFITCERVVKDPDTGEVTEIHCTYDPETQGGNAPDGRKVKGTIHWVSVPHSLAVEVRLYDRLFSASNPDEVADEQDFSSTLNAESLVTLTESRIEPSVADDPPGNRYQFERQGYFVSDIVDSTPGKLVYNRTVTLRDTWAKIEAKRETRQRVDDRGESKQRPRAEKKSEQRSRVRVGADDREARLARYTDEAGLTLADAEMLAENRTLARYFDDAVAAHANPRAVAAWVINDIQRELKVSETLPFGGRELAALVALIDEGTISRALAKDVFAEMVERGGDPDSIVREKNLAQLSDRDQLDVVVSDVLAANSDKVGQYMAGKKGLLGFFIGQVMKETGGRANAEVVSELLRNRIG